jgi:hypothetical protein
MQHEMTWYVDNNLTRWRLVTECRRNFGGTVSVTLYDGEQLTVPAAALRVWK